MRTEVDKPAGYRRVAQAFRAGLLLLMAIAVLGVGAAEGKKKTKTRKALPPPPPDLRGHVNYLARQLYGVPLDESENITNQIQKLVLDHLTEWMPGQILSAMAVALDVRVRRELEDVFSQLHYPFFGQPAVFVQPWKDRTLIGAGYTLGWSDYDRVNVLGLFESVNGQTRLAAATNFVPRTDLHYEFLAAPQTENFRFFIYGTRLGKSQPRLSAVLSDFDGQSLKTLWKTEDAFDGRLDVGQDRVVLRYLKEDEYVRETAHRRKPPRHEAVYKITPQGLDLETDHEIPF